MGEAAEVSQEILDGWATLHNQLITEHNLVRHMLDHQVAGAVPCAIIDGLREAVADTDTMLLVASRRGFACVTRNDRGA